MRHKTKGHEMRRCGWAFRLSAVLAAAAASGQPGPGDLDGDGFVSIIDEVFLEQHLLGDRIAICLYSGDIDVYHRQGAGWNIEGELNTPYQRCSSIAKRPSALGDATLEIAPFILGK